MMEDRAGSIGRKVDRGTQYATPRNGLLDYARLIAACGIVWFHVEAPGYRAAYAALPFFLVLLTLPSRAGPAQRARRLLVPFAIWSAIYALFLVFLAMKSGQDPFRWWRPEMIATGPSTHLWFLPFAFMVGLAAPVLRGTAAGALPLLAACLLAVAGETDAPPWHQWGFGLIPAVTGFAFQRNRILALMSLAAGFLVLELFRPSPDNLVILGGTALACLMLSFRLPATRISALCARLSIWVYLGHVLVIHRFQSDGLDGSALGLASICGALALAALIEVVLRRLRPGVAAQAGSPP
jgi:surface polysaccharide O-acyltransferase-like enzyme